MYGTAERDQRSHDHYASNAKACGHSEQCELVRGHWTTVDGVGVNWPTLRGRPACTCRKTSPFARRALASQLPAKATN